MLLAACRHGSAATPDPGEDGVRPPRIIDTAALYRMRGAWRWSHTTTEEGTYRIERERWLIDAIERLPDGHDALLGRYRRDVNVVSLDGTPFVCSQQAAYTQVAVHDVKITAREGEVVVEETGYRTLPSPCEHGFRKLGSYRAMIADRRVTLAWDGGSQTLISLGDDIYPADAVELPAQPGDDAGRFGGRWRWSMRSRADDGDVRDEEERWELAVGGDGTVGGTYQRAVVVSSGDGAPLACAGATSYGFVDRYTLRGAIGEDGLRFDEVAVEPGDHPCLAATPDRHLDSAFGEVEGDYLILTWRGKRRQVLHR